MWQSEKQIINVLKSRPKWIYILPIKTGWYIVETITSFGNSNTLKSHYNHLTKKWNFSNQNFYRYLS